MITRPSDAAEEEEVLCVGCGYSLRGLRPDGACPECGAAIARSLAGDRLSFADPDWTRRIAQGARLMLHGYRIFFWIVWTLFLAFWFSMCAGGQWLLGRFTIDLPSLFRFAIVGAAIVGVGTALLGILLLTMPDPRSVGRERLFSVRRMSRGAIGMMLACAAATAAMTGVPRGNVFWAIATIVSYLVAASAVIGWSAAMRHLAALMRRTPHRELGTWLTGTARRFEGRALGLIAALAIHNLPWSKLLVIPGTAVSLRVILSIFCGLLILVLLPSLSGLSKALAECRLWLDHCSRKAAAWADRPPRSR